MVSSPEGGVRTAARMVTALLLCAPALATGQGEPLPAPRAAFTREFCMPCHSTEKQKGDVDLEALSVDWESETTRELLANMLEMLEMGDMPPEKAASHPSAEQRADMVAWLRSELEAHSTASGTVLRRLNRVEYQNTIRDLFGIDFTVPGSFPLDSTAHGFDTIGAALVISPPQLRQYLEVASQVADELIPLTEAVPIDRHFPGSGFTGPMSGLLEDRQRLVTTIDELIWTDWHDGFEVRRDGRYRLTVRAAVFGTLPGGTARLELRARPRSAPFEELYSSCRLVGSLTVEPGEPQDLVLEADLLSGECLALQFANSPLRKSNRFIVHPETVEYVAREHPEFLDAMIAVGYDAGESMRRNYERIVGAMGTPEGVPTEEQRVQYMRGLEAPGAARAFLFPAWQRLHELGPALDVFDLRVEGPLGPLQDLPSWLPKQGGLDDRSYAEEILRPLVRRALRKPLSEADVEHYVELALEHGRDWGGVRAGLHFAVRVLLCSPDFLYRGTREGRLDDHDLATRLSYFLWSTTPSDRLLDLADAGALSDQRRLVEIVRQMIRDPRALELAANFTGQWLWTRKISGIMPDERLFPMWNPLLYSTLTEESERFFLAVLRENLDVENFLDSDFTFVDARLAQVYGIPGVVGQEMRRVALDGTHHRGGVLGQAAVMMATANGVDTSPVIRGVWLLENIAGEGVGEPPDNVPALTPDSTGATTIGERIALHRADPMCARCHDRIDPMGFALESFDAIGGWREHYPRVVATEDGESAVEDGLPVDTSGDLPDGTHIRDIEDLRAWLLADPDRFYRCLAEKLMVYGTGREPNQADRAVLDDITRAAAVRGHGFEDLVLAVVLSDSFRTK